MSLATTQLTQDISTSSPTFNIDQKISEMKELRRKKILEATLFCTKQKLSKEDLILIFGQYWRALNYFPDFLASALLSVETLKEKGAIAKVLSEELGDGVAELSHEYAYFRALESIGIAESAIKTSPQNEKTKLLMDGYRSGKQDADKAIGYFLSTEIADLWIVSNLGKIMIQNMEIKGSVPWIDLHISQEPGHVTSAAGCLEGINDLTRVERILKYANECSDRWDAFFEEIAKTLPSGLKINTGVV